MQKCECTHCMRTTKHAVYESGVKYCQIKSIRLLSILYIGFSQIEIMVKFFFLNYENLGFLLVGLGRSH